MEKQKKTDDFKKEEISIQVFHYFLEKSMMKNLQILNQIPGLKC